jgi:murein DD-endopeptidase MepM/ murein hydrolase activator NlpD
MRKRSVSRTARAAFAILGAALVIRVVETGYKIQSHGKLREASHDLLYNQESPFQQDAITSSDGMLRPQSKSGETNENGVVNRDGSSAHKVFRHKVARGDTLARFWSDIGGASEDAEKFFQAFDTKHQSNNLLRAGESVSVTHADGEVVEVRRKLSDEALFIVAGNSDDGYRSRIEKLEITSRDRQVTGVITSSLVDAADTIGLPYELVDEFVDLFSSRVEFRKDLQPGDTFSVLFEERFNSDGESIAPGSIKAASIKIGGEILAVVRDVDAHGKVRYFDEKGHMPTKSFLRYPVQYTRISSVFAKSRFHPVLLVNRPHNGVDFSAPTGTPVRTIGDGVVTFAGYNKSMGNTVRIAHGSRYVTEYMHLSKISAGLKKGSKVGRGMVIGAVGATGLASGPHLHFGLFDNGRYIDPLQAKIADVYEETKAPKAVLAMISDIKKLHDTIAVASSATTSARKKA